MKHATPAPTKAAASAQTTVEPQTSRQTPEAGEFSLDSRPQSAGGRPLDAPTRGTMEARFGHDFSKVRIHADERSAAMADRLDAAAFNVGNNIYFGRNAYDPRSRDGTRLIAHELAHVVHRARTGPPRQGVAPVGSIAEAKAEAATERFASGSSLRGGSFRDWGPAWAVHRQVVKGISKPGTVEHTGEVGRAPGETGVPTGKVEVRTGEEIELDTGAKLPDFIAIQFSGAIGPAEESHWLQFAWFDLVATTPSGPVYVGGSVPTTGGNMKFTNDPGAPAWSIDSLSSSSPFYETAGFNIRTGNSTTIFDAPGGHSVAPLAAYAFKSVTDATRVVLSAHFSAYLIQYDKAAYHVQYQVSTAFELSGNQMIGGAKGYTVGASGQVVGLPNNLRDLLHSNYPEHTNVQ